MTIPVTVVILTLNEERNLAACLDSVADFDDVHVLDSGSTDRTREIAAERSVPFTVNPFSGFGDQRNWAIDRVPARYPWQFHLDADERMTPALAAELAAALATDPAFGGYFVPSKLMFAGRWLRHAGQYPGYQVRFFHSARLRFANHGHGQREVTTHPIGVLKEPLVHYGFSHGLDHWFRKHILYARREAEQAFESPSGGGGFFARDPTVRRRAMKRFVRRWPGRYILRLAYMLVWKRAILDGWAGMAYTHMIATYESMIDVYLRVLKHDVDPDDLGRPNRTR